MVYDASVSTGLNQSISAYTNPSLHGRCGTWGVLTHSDWIAWGLSTSDNAELLAIDQAISGTAHILLAFGKVHIFSDSLTVLWLLVDASVHSGQTMSLNLLWNILPWLAGVPNSQIHLHHVGPGVELDAHSVVHLMATAIKAEVRGNPH